MNNSLQIKRIMNEMSEMKKNPSEMYYAGPLENDLRTWHFTIRGPKESEFEEGLYHGKIELSSEYPIKPPNLYFLTANGRFEVNTKICLNITKFHKESWNPAFTIKTMLEALISYFPIREPGFAGVGALDYSKEERKKLAILSQKFKCDKCGSLIEILPILKKEEEKKPEEIKIQDNILLKNENENEQIDDPLKNHQDSNKLAYELKNLKETIKEQQAKFNIPFLKNVGNNLKKNDENRVPSNKFEKNSISLTFDSVLAEFNLYQEVIKSVKFSKNPLNIEKNIEEEKFLDIETLKQKETNIPEKTTNETKNEFSESNLQKNNEFKEENQELAHAKNTLKLFNNIIKIVQIIILIAVISYIYLM